MSKNGSADSEERFRRIEEAHAETAQLLRRQAKVLSGHASAIAEHDAHMAQFDERLERMGRHLEVLIYVTDGPIRAGGKKRHG
jgi:L-ascorbate metabolism protein UlaG (beta-lactamase superfamily)